jgi:glucose/mannose transport system substrate-binding protein
MLPRCWRYALPCLALGCSDPDEPSEPKKLELLTWWSQPTELSAIQAVIDVHATRHPHVEVEVLKSDNLDTLGSDVQNRLAEGDPPTAFQANLGENALKWAESAQDLSERSAAWADHFDAGILERLMDADGKLVGVPLALTRQNNAYYNLAMLEQLELDIPEGRDELDAWLAALGELGFLHPLCMGDQDNWVSLHVLFEDIVPAYVGAQHSRDFWSGELRADDELFGDALDYAASLNPYWNLDVDVIDMVQGVTRVMEELDPSEQCLMTPMGDWGGAILAETYAVDQDFAQRSWPGAEDLFVLAGDAFVTTRGVKNQQAALDFFDTLASEAGQIAFNAKKGSVPARSIAEARQSEFGPLTQANLADFSVSDALPGFKVIGSSEFPWDELAERTHDFLLVGDKQPIIDLIAQHYDKLAR